MPGLGGDDADATGAPGGAEDMPPIVPAGCRTGARGFAVIGVGLGVLAGAGALIEGLRGGDAATGAGMGVLLGLFGLVVAERARTVLRVGRRVLGAAHGRGAVVGLVLGVVWMTGEFAVDPAKVDAASGTRVFVTVIMGAVWAALGGVIGRAMATGLWTGLGFGVVAVPFVLLAGRARPGPVTVTLQAMWLLALLPALGALAEAWGRGRGGAGDQPSAPDLSSPDLP